MGLKVSDEDGFRSPIAAIASDKTLSGGIAATNRSFMHLWTKIML